VIITLKFHTAQERDLGIKVVSVGNLIVGGSGKTPVVTALARAFKNSAIVLRGYGRESQGLHVVSDANSILCDVACSGDEAMIYAQKLKNCIVIVSEDRVEGIKKAQEMGASWVLLDDAYAKHTIKKLDFLIEVQTQNNFFLPSGPYRERYYAGKKIVPLREDSNFYRVVSYKNQTEKMALVTAIARPERLDKYLCEGVVAKYYFEDHHTFTKEEIESILEKSQASSLLVTYKDYVKLKDFDVPLSLMDLEIKLDKKIITIVKDYLEEKN